MRKHATELNVLSITSPLVGTLEGIMNPEMIRRALDWIATEIYVLRHPDEAEQARAARDARNGDMDEATLISLMEAIIKLGIPTEPIA